MFLDKGLSGGCFDDGRKAKGAIENVNAIEDHRDGLIRDHEENLSWWLWATWEPGSLVD